METVIVDGDNVLQNWVQFKRDMRKGLSQARRNLLKELSAYGTASDNEVIVIFNGSLSDPTGLSGDPEPDLQIVFARNGQGVLSTIKRLVRESQDPASILVATADDKLGRYVEKLGARRMTGFKFQRVSGQPKRKQQSRENRKQKPRSGVTLAQMLDRKSLNALKELRANLKG